jgi:hypothetical protein
MTSISPDRTRASRISKAVGNVRRSARIAERVRRIQIGISAPSDTAKATGQRSVKFIQQQSPPPQIPKEKKAMLNDDDEDGEGRQSS